MSKNLKTHINDTVKEAMRARDSESLTTLRMITAAIKQIEIDKQVQLDDAQVTEVLVKLLKQRAEAEVQFAKAGRGRLSEKRGG